MLLLLRLVSSTLYEDPHWSLRDLAGVLDAVVSIFFPFHQPLTILLLWNTLLSLLLVNIRWARIIVNYFAFWDMLMISILSLSFLFYLSWLHWRLELKHAHAHTPLPLTSLATVWGLLFHSFA